MSEYNNGAGYALDWDSEIQYTESSYVTLAEGTYPFTVTSFDRQNYDGGQKVPPCRMAVVHLAVDGGDQGVANVDERLYLHTSMLWKLSEFFHAIGQLEKDGSMHMNWNAVPGATGMVEVSVNEYTNKNGEKKKNNRVARFLPPEERPVRQAVPPQTAPAPQWNAPPAQGAAPAQQMAMDGFQRQGRVAEYQQADGYQPGKF